MTNHYGSDQPWQRIIYEPVDPNNLLPGIWEDYSYTSGILDHRTNRSSKDSVQSQWLRMPIEEKLRRMPDPPLCFCGKLATKTNVKGHGVIYDCHWSTAASEKRICGFHIHEYAWNMFRKVLEKGRHFSEHDPELRTCPFFNYTFCVLFHIINSYPKSHPKTPKCFCQIPVIMSEKIEHRRPLSIAIVFKCRNYDISGAKPKCLYMLSAEQVPFIKPKRPIHQPDLNHEFFNPKYLEMLKAKGLICDSQKKDSEKNEGDNAEQQSVPPSDTNEPAPESSDEEASFVSAADGGVENETSSKQNDAASLL